MQVLCRECRSPACCSFPPPAADLLPEAVHAEARPDVGPLQQVRREEPALQAAHALRPRHHAEGLSRGAATCREWQGYCGAFQEFWSYNTHLITADPLEALVGGADIAHCPREDRCASWMAV